MTAEPEWLTQNMTAGDLNRLVPGAKALLLDPALSGEQVVTLISQMLIDAGHPELVNATPEQEAAGPWWTDISDEQLRKVTTEELAAALNEMDMADASVLSHRWRTVNPTGGRWGSNFRDTSNTFYGRGALGELDREDQAPATYRRPIVGTDVV